MQLVAEQGFSLSPELFKGFFAGLFLAPFGATFGFILGLFAWQPFKGAMYGVYFIYFAIVLTVILGPTNNNVGVAAGGLASLGAYFGVKELLEGGMSPADLMNSLSSRMGLRRTIQTTWGGVYHLRADAFGQYFLEGPIDQINRYSTLGPWIAAGQHAPPVGFRYKVVDQPGPHRVVALYPADWQAVYYLRWNA